MLGLAECAKSHVLPQLWELSTPSHVATTVQNLTDETLCQLFALGSLTVEDLLRKSQVPYFPAWYEAWTDENTLVSDGYSAWFGLMHVLCLLYSFLFHTNRILMSDLWCYDHWKQTSFSFLKSTWNWRCDSLPYCDVYPSETASGMWKKSKTGLDFVLGIWLDHRKFPICSKLWMIFSPNLRWNTRHAENRYCQCFW